MSRIVITGMGVISALGNSVDDHLAALRKTTCGLSSLEFVKTKFADTLRFGEIKTSTSQLKEKLFVKDKGATRTDLLALYALREAINNSGLADTEISSYDTALIGASTVGGMCLTDELYHDSNNISGHGSDYLASYDCAAPVLFLQQRYRIGGIVNSINTACSSSSNAIMYGARLIKNGLVKRAVVGGMDSLAKFTINGFNSLSILAPQFCRPFDKERNGLNLGEGAAFLVLEKEEDVRNKKGYAALSGYGNANDAFHPSSLSENGEGPYLAMSKALAVAQLNASEINFINTHGTGTENNDEVEGKAMQRIFTDVPPFISSKSKIGHTLGAAGAIEAVFSILALNNNEIYPSLNFREPIESTGLIPVTVFQKYNIEKVMTNAFGFGGNCTSLIFSKL
ncbi:MAG TPA: beta-ketoacyl-[acyl-carrier-protein] synthase family protein [Bacteroidia bacterium]|nr:beta-ketoacyl-[acyl-carrier-protein] synthase family protein [Bacteroidia bacterium]